MSMVHGFKNLIRAIVSLSSFTLAAFDEQFNVDRQYYTISTMVHWMFALMAAAQFPSYWPVP